MVFGISLVLFITVSLFQSALIKEVQCYNLINFSDKCLNIFLAITGNPNVGFSAADLDRDFDPASYDEVMARAFDDSYYAMTDEGEGEGEGKGEEGKPVFSDDDGE